MTSSITRRDLARIEREASQEAAEIQRNHPPSAAPRLGRKCRICAHPESLELVNRLLAHGMNLPTIVDTCEHFNATRPKNFQITYASVRWHAKYHFNVQEPAQAAWRRIMERRKAQHASEGETVAEGVESLLTLYGYLEIMGQKGLQTLVDPETKISAQDGLSALKTLDELTRKGAGEAEMLALRRQFGVLQQAIRDVVPEEMWGAISERISEVYSPTKSDENVVDAEVVDDDDDYGFGDEAYSPTVDTDPDDMD